jgi:hypothetical protein
MSISQIPLRRTFLSTVDFSTLDIHSRDSILHLTFNEDGTPQRRGQTKAGNWVEQTGQIREKTMSEVIPRIDRSTQDLLEAAVGLQDISANGTEHDMMERSLKLLDMANEVGQRAEEMVNIVKSMKDDVKAYIDGMAARME